MPQILKWSFIKFFGADRKLNFINFYRKTQRDRSKFKRKPTPIVAARGSRIYTKFSDKQIRDLNNAKFTQTQLASHQSVIGRLTGFASGRSNASPSGAVIFARSAILRLSGLFRLKTDISRAEIRNGIL
ncbi:hypothetical protein [uncultured Campylobacter sp.]|uniref:hypothetical protein n=1 Tax=uncultured Campylobacter sp. TaxID=218934 RepID=UPI0028E3A758|nr:hypothetical protein [uncultured Campylobacter sp.]